MADHIYNNVYHYIYKITNLINGKVYIGRHSTKNIDDGYMGSGTVLRESIKKHGKQNFIKEILEYTKTFDELCNLEEEYIKKYKTKYGKMCYNISNKSCGYEYGNKIPEEELKRRRENNLGSKNPMYGKNIKDYMTPQKYDLWRKHISESTSGKNNPRFGKEVSQQTRDKIGKANKKLWDDGRKNGIKMGRMGHKNTNEHINAVRLAHIGLKHTKETREKMSLSHSTQEAKEYMRKLMLDRLNSTESLIYPFCGFKSKSNSMMKRWHFDKCKMNPNNTREKSNNVKKVYQYTLDGKLINVFNSIKEANEYFNKSYSHIDACCRNERKVCFGYKWSYKLL